MKSYKLFEATKENIDFMPKEVYKSIAAINNKTVKFLKATLKSIEEDDLRAHAKAMGDVICDGFKAAFVNEPGVVAVRNAGLMIGVELDRPCGDLVKRALAEKVLINVTADKVVRLLPPLVINQAEAEQLVAAAHIVCPYSNATRGNIDVNFNIVTTE